MEPNELKAILEKTNGSESERRVLECTRPRVYVAGAISADTIIKGLENLNRGMRIATELLLEGYAPYSPFFDFHFSFIQRMDAGERVSVQDYYESSAMFIDNCHVLYIEATDIKATDHIQVRSGTDWQDSVGTINEIKRAQAHKVPVVIGGRDLLRFICPLSDKQHALAMRKITLRNKRVDCYQGIYTLD